MGDQRYPLICTMKIGDISGDGHSMTVPVFFSIQCASPEWESQIQEIRAAHAAAKAAHPDLDPETYCNDYEEDQVPRPVADQWAAAGVSVRLQGGRLDIDGMAHLCAEFLNLGNPALQVKPVSNPIRSIQGFGGHLAFRMVGYGLISP